MKSIFIISMWLMATLCCSQQFSKSEMDSLFAALEKNNKGMGNLSIFYDGKEIYNKSIGYADIDKKIKIDNNTKFRIGSISKSFTATIIMQLIEEGKLKLDQTVDKFFKDIKNSDSITIEMLLHHRSGIHNFTDDPAYMSWSGKPISHEELLEKIVAGGIDFEPNAMTKYSNSNFILLTLIVEELEKNSYDKILEKRIIKPLRLKRTNFGTKINTATNEALPYYYSGKWNLGTETDVSVPLGAGGIVSTSHDLNVFMYALQNGKLISPESFQKMKDIISGLGLGLIEFSFNDKKSYGHGGAIDRFLSNSEYFDEDKLGISYCTNGVAMNIYEIRQAVLSIYFNIPYQVVEFMPALKLKEEELKVYQGEYSCATLPYKIKFSVQNAALVGQKTDRPPFPLEAFDKDKFRFGPAGMVLEFSPAENSFVLKQGGQTFEFKRE